MTGPWPHGKAAPTPGAALPHVYRIMECGHPRIAVDAIPEHLSLWCPECATLRPQAPKPYTPEQEYTLRVTLYEAAKARRDAIAAALILADNDLDNAAMAMTELEVKPGIPAYTKPWLGARP